MRQETIRGLGCKNSPFLYLDHLIQPPNWDTLHTDVSFGIAKSHWDKRFVSSGVHTDWEQLEVTPHIRDYKLHMTESQQQIFETLTLTEEKIKFVNALLSVPHPFWLIFIRNNKRIERTGIQNKAVSDDSSWTENAQYFPSLISFIETMPFESIGRVMLFMTESNNQTVPHFDAGTQIQRDTKPNDDFIWFKTAPKSKSLFVMNPATKEKIYPENGKRFVWFNEMDYHGTDAFPGFTFSVRIDGKFIPSIRERLLGV